MNLRPWLSSCNQGGAQLLFFLTLGLVTLLALSPSPPPEIDTLGDKFNHLIAFFVLALLADFGWPGMPFLLRKALPLLLYGIALEGLQHLMPPRVFSLNDILANVGGLAAYLLVLPLRRRWLPGTTVDSCRIPRPDHSREQD